MIFKVVLFLLLTIFSFSTAQAKRAVALVPLKNDASSSLEWVSGGVEYLLVNKLSVLSGFFVVDRTIVEKAIREIKIAEGALNSKSSGQLGRATNAEVTISGSYQESGSNLDFEILYHNTGNGDLIYKEKITTGKGDIKTAVNKIVQQLLLISGVPVTSKEEALMSRDLTANNQAFESFIKAYMENRKARPNNNVVISLFKEAISKDANFWEAYYNLGIVYFNTDQFDQSLAQFNKIIRALPNFDKPYYGRGLIYEKQKKYKEAIEDFLKVTDFNPNDPKPYYYLGKISILDNKFAEAKKYLDQSVAINPDYAPAYYEYGNLAVAQKEVRKSIADYRRAVELDPANNKYRQTLGEIYYRSQIYYNALVEFQTILKDDPSDPVANFMLGITIYKQAVLEELVEAFLDLLDETNVDQQGTGEKKFNKSTGMDPLKKGKVYNDMVDAFKKAIAGRDNFMQATFNLALTYLEMGDYSNSERYFKATILIKPDLIKAYTKLAEVYEKTNRMNDAMEQYRRVFYIEPAIFVSKPTLGAEHQYRDVLAIFLNELDEKIKRNPNDTNSNLVLAKVFRAQGFNGKAANILRSILNKNPRNEEAKSLLARIEKQTG
jgi:tetratricopeptide (TPR) repeat protein